ncbi:hypothetical protein MQM1_020 [Aeromonas phage vB_AsaP_MQM1]|nr:hypothetical protein MQM1_020 [Aeromonas phage vB_AsaP_MQM1]
MIRPDQLFSAPIPGQSLTEAPDSRRPWELPPKFNTSGQALDHLFNTIIGKKFQRNFHKLMKEDKQFFVDRIAAQMLQEGFLNGLWTVDLMLVMVEPLIIMLVWLSSTMDLTVSFSTDNGSEDRTGFEGIFEAMMGGPVGFDDAAQATEDAAQGPDAASQGAGQPAEQPQATPSAQQGMVSPLVGGM